MRRRSISVFSGMAVTLALLLWPTFSMGAGPTTNPTGAADFYKDKKVTLVVTYRAGGGTDFLARLFSSYWSEVTGGSMVVRNKSGGGGLEGSNYVYGAKPDGLTMGLTVRSAALVSPTIFKAPGVEFDINKLNWIGFVGAEPYVFSVGAKSSYNSMADLGKAKRLKFAALGPRDSPSLYVAFITEVFGLDAKIISGYGGSTESALSVGRGETDGYAFECSVIKRDIDKGLVKTPLLVLDHKRTAWFPDVPTLPELAKLSAGQQPLFDILATLSGGKVFFAGPGIPEERVEFMQDAFNQIMKIKAFKRQVKLRWPVWVEPESGKQTAATLRKLMAVPKQDVVRLEAILKKHGR